MYGKQHGMVLLWTVILLLLLALLMTRLLQSSELNIKMISHYQQLQSVFYAAQAALLSGETMVYSTQKAACLIDSQDINYTTRRRADWWLNWNQCSASQNEIVSYYVIEDLGIEPCVQVAKSQNKDELTNSMAHFYRVSSRAKLWDNSAILLQSTVVVPELSELACNQKTTQEVSSGRQSWREILDY